MDEDRALVARQLIEVAPELDRAVPGVQLLIAGGGNVFDELFAKAKEVNAALGRNCVTMTGPRTDINRIVAAGQVFVGVSRAALEAMAAAKPVIVDAPKPKKEKPKGGTKESDKLIRRLEREIEKQENAIAELDEKIEAASADYQELTRLLGEKEEAEMVLMDLMEQWEAAQEG
jgi:hypothetical protein